MKAHRDSFLKNPELWKEHKKAEAKRRKEARRGKEARICIKNLISASKDVPIKLKREET